MRHSRLLRVLLLVLAVGGVVLVALRPGRLPLTELPDPPRPEPVARPGEFPLALAGLLDAPLLDEAELRRRHNEVVETWRRRLADYEGGGGALREAERLELHVLVLRRALGVLDEAAFHAGVAKLLARELERMRQRRAMEPPQASDAELRELRAYLARERLLAGETNHEYPRHRAAQREALEDRVHYLEKQQPDEAEAARLDLAAFEAACPPPEELAQRAPATPREAP